MLSLDISPSLMTDLTTFVPKNTVVRFDDIIKITLDFPVIKRLEMGHEYEIKFLVSKNFLVTVHYEEMSSIDRFKRQFEVASTLHKKRKGYTGAHLFMSLFTNLYDSALAKLDYVETKLTEIEADIFKDNEKQMVYEISRVSKQLISFRHTLHSHEDVLLEMSQQFEDVFKDTFAKELHVIRSQFRLLQHKANAQFETMTALRETNGAMLTTKQNEVIKTLTILAFITFPLTLFSSVFGMNTEATPIIGMPFDFWIIVGCMIFAATSFFIFFKKNGWM